MQPLLGVDDMDTLAAFALGEKNRNKEEMVFDWDTAARLIKAAQPKVASAGLRDDWEWTAGEIYRDGEIEKNYTYLASTWAVPELELDGVLQPCFVMKNLAPEWDQHTKWPQSSIDILSAQVRVIRNK
jgi:hypothetical protein